MVIYHLDHRKTYSLIEFCVTFELINECANYPQQKINHIQRLSTLAQFIKTWPTHRQILDSLLQMERRCPRSALLDG